MNNNTINRALRVAEIVNQHYEPERQDRCKTWVYRNFVNKIYPMTERTFWRMLAIANRHEAKNAKK
ncbi:MAG: hypothetical protein PHW82_00490 [Bacteroidales bacterium]|nr:hypothetical protein [Bacteroidales bacterium]